MRYIIELLMIFYILKTPVIKAYRVSHLFKQCKYVCWNGVRLCPTLPCTLGGNLVGLIVAMQCPIICLNWSESDRM